MPTPAERRWEPIVRSARRSGLSMRAYARQHGLNEYTLAGWNSRIPDLPPASDFCELTLAVPPLRLQIGHAHVDVHPSTDLALLRRVVEALS
jgi:hypothetical protein